MPFLSSIWAKLIAAGAIILGILLAFLRAFSQIKQAGRDEIARKDAEAEAAALKRMQEAAAKAPQDDQAVIDRAKGGTL
jgi:CHASE3 domain sensor protein